jgi:predicted NAD/FAD-binding protein
VSAAANGAPLLATVAAAAGASLLSLAQRRLSTPVRRIRRKAAEVSGSVRYSDGTVEAIDAARLISAPESALRLLWLAIAAISIGTLLARWTSG